MRHSFFNPVAWIKLKLLAADLTIVDSKYPATPIQYPLATIGREDQEEEELCPGDISSGPQFFS